MVEGRPLGSSRVSSRAICAKHQNEKRKNAGAEEPAMYSAIYKMQLFYPQFRESQPATAGGTNIATPLLL